MTLQRAVLELDADVDGDGTEENGVFEMVGNLDYNQSITTGFLLGGRGSTINSILSSITADGDPQRRGYALDLGGGRHQFQFQFLGWEGARDSDGNALQWGTSATESIVRTNSTMVSATGQDPMTQIACLAQYIRVGQFDSRNFNARLRVGEYSDGTYAATTGEYDDYLNVAVESLREQRSAQSDPDTFNGTMTMFEIASWDVVVDAAERLGI